MARITSSDSIRVEGLHEVNKALRDLGGKELQKELRDAGKVIAGFVADDAGSNARSLGGVAAKSAPSIKAAAGFTSAGVRFGGSAYPFAGGAEFGGQGRPTTQQFQPWRGSGANAGYFVYPAVRSNSARIEDEYLGAVDDILERNGLK